MAYLSSVSTMISFTTLFTVFLDVTLAVVPEWLFYIFLYFGMWHRIIRMSALLALVLSVWALRPIVTGDGRKCGLSMEVLTSSIYFLVSVTFLYFGTSFCIYLKTVFLIYSLKVNSVDESLFFSLNFEITK